MIEMISKLIIYEYKTAKGYAHYSEYADDSGRITHKAWSGISETSAAELPIKAVYEGKDAARALWDIQFDEMTDHDRKIIMSVFPKLPEKDKATLKMPSRLIGIARAKIRKHFGVTCRRCGGSGSYARSVAYTEIDDGICHLCGGSGKSLPILTEKKLAEIKAFFVTEANA